MYLLLSTAFPLETDPLLIWQDQIGRGSQQCLRGKEVLVQSWLQNHNLTDCFGSEKSCAVKVAAVTLLGKKGNTSDNCECIFLHSDARVYCSLCQAMLVKKLCHMIFYIIDTTLAVAQASWHACAASSANLGLLLRPKALMESHGQCPSRWRDQPVKKDWELFKVRVIWKVLIF